MKKTPFLRVENFRRLIQIAFFVLFVFLFLATTGKFDYKTNSLALPNSHADFFFIINPYLALTTMLSTRNIIGNMLYGVIPVLLISIFMGRFFCGWICPLGTTLDITNKLFIRKHSEPQSNPKTRKIKYYILIASIFTAIFGIQTAYFLDPFVILNRAFTFVFYPILQLTAQLSPKLASSIYISSDMQYYFRLNIFAFLIFTGILVLSSISQRFWCRNLCPLGALLGLLSRFAIFKRIVNNKCITCNKCAPECKMGAIMNEPTHYKASECIYCYACVHQCPVLVTQIIPAVTNKGYKPSTDLSKRRLLQAAGLGTTFALLFKTNVSSKTARNGLTKLSNSQLIRPPGALAEERFVDQCVRCTNCMKVCPTGGLQPSIVEAGLEGLWTPVLVPQIGECVQACNLCSKVCPSKAIESVEIKEKSHIFIGRAVIDKSLCVVWNSGKKCLVCDECCSYNAIYWKDVDGISSPFIEEYSCVGCGICENVCPIQPVAAIKVHSIGDKRQMTREQQLTYHKNTKVRKKN